MSGAEKCLKEKIATKCKKGEKTKLSKKTKKIFLLVSFIVALILGFFTNKIMTINIESTASIVFFTMMYGLMFFGIFLFFIG